MVITYQVDPVRMPGDLNKKNMKYEGKVPFNKASKGALKEAKQLPFIS